LKIDGDQERPGERGEDGTKEWRGAVKGRKGDKERCVWWPGRYRFYPKFYKKKLNHAGTVAMGGRQQKMTKGVTKKKMKGKKGARSRISTSAEENWREGTCNRKKYHR